MLVSTTAHGQDRLCADQNNDGVVSPADFSAWVANFNAGDLTADVNQNGSVEPADFSAWVAAFNQGANGPICSSGDSTGLDVAGDISPLGDVDTYTLTANAGSDILFSIGETSGTSFTLQAELYGPSGQLIDSRSVEGGFQLDAFNVSESGTYTFVIRENGDNAVGSYQLTAIVADQTLDADNVELTSGQSIPDSIAIGDIDTFTIEATPGSDLLLSIGETTGSSFVLHTSVYGPNGQLIESQSRDGGFRLDLYNVAGGTYTYIIRENGSNSVGSYSLTALVADSTIDADNTQLSSGQSTTGAIDIGDIDTFTVDATSGSDLLLTIGETSGSGFVMHVDVYGPDGSFIRSRTLDGGFELNLLNVAPGRYTYVIRDSDSINTGTYNLTAVVADSAMDADNTTLLSGQTTTGSIDIGDIDTFTISAASGNDLLFTIGETAGSGFVLDVSVYGPNGQLLDFVALDAGFQLDLYNVSTTGIYTYVVRDNGGSATGSYSLTAVVADQTIDADNTQLQSGQTATGSINTGDIDTFTINAAAGTDLLMTIGETGGSGFLLLVEVYGPDGEFLDARSLDSGFELNLLNLAQSGVYTFVVRDNGGTATGSYSLTVIVADTTLDADNLQLTSGQLATGSINVGDIDTFTIDAPSGSDLQMTINETGGSGFLLRVDIYGPNGSFIASQSIDSGFQINLQNIVLGGTYTYIVRANGGDNTGSYGITATVVN